MYQASLPVFIQGLKNMSAILTKASAFCEKRKVAPEVLVNSRLAPDMFPLARQIQIATDGVKGAAGRLSGTEIPSYADTESTLDELQERIAKTIAYLETFKPAQIDGTEDKDINLKVGGRDLSFKGQEYLVSFVIPNFYFHTTTAYAILRHNGIHIGKLDFLGSN